jgi:hypothetical protein
MTDQISDLLHADADRIAVPPAPAAAVLAEGRRLRGRRRAQNTGIGVAAAAVLAVAGFSVPTHAPLPQDPELVSASPIDPQGWAVAEDSTVHLGNGRIVNVPGKVKAMYYTSAGVMVRIGREATTAADDSNYWVLDGDGTVHDFNLDLGKKKPGTDPTLPYLAYAEKDSSLLGGLVDHSHWALVLRDVRTGKVAQRVPFEGAFTWGGWNAPPTALSGDYAYVGVDDATLRINWRTGTVAKARGLAASRMPTVAGGREVIDPGQPDGTEEPSSTRTYRVLDATTGATARRIDVPTTADAMIWPGLAPDGGHLLVAPFAGCTDDDACTYDPAALEVYSVDTGSHRTIRFDPHGTFGWSPDGRLLLVSKSSVRSCDAETGACRSTAVDLDATGRLKVRVSGNDNEI